MIDFRIESPPPFAPLAPGESVIPIYFVRSGQTYADLDHEKKKTPYEERPSNEDKPIIYPMYKKAVLTKDGEFQAQLLSDELRHSDVVFGYAFSSQAPGDIQESHLVCAIPTSLMTTSPDSKDYCGSL